MIDIPAQFQDIQEVLVESGFRSGDVWYHGTSSALVDSILNRGLVRSGDQDLNKAAKSTMATIGNSYTETREPVFLTPSKALAYYWASKTVARRSVRFEGEEQAVVLAVRLDTEAANVKPDVGAAGMLIVQGGDGYLDFLKEQYELAGQSLPEFDLSKVSRDDYLSILGLAYIDQDLPADKVALQA
ncbi:MAG: hypothetical protein C9356_03220 [Oleiphilus sp.]|nr:MAG: hypothetical protein C9356_03220 [Oleiphilus sp.]